MRTNLPITDQEQTYPAEVEIVSTTDLKGRITYVNDAFVKVSGFAEEELLGKAHNIVRHPHMPCQAFESLWDHLKQGRPWMGLVQNRCKNGDFYWVDAFVSPVYRGGNVVGYESVRVRPKAEWRTRAETLYPLLKKGKSGKLGGLRLVDKLSLIWVALIIPFGGLVFLPSPTWIWGWLAVAMIAGWCTLRWSLKPLSTLADESRRYSDDDVARFVYGGRGDEVGQLKTAILSLEARIRIMRNRFSSMALELEDKIKQNQVATETTKKLLEEQHRAIQSLASAIEELNHTIHAISGNADQAAVRAGDTTGQAEEGVRVSQATAEGIGELAAEVEKAAGVIRQVEEESNNIGMVVGVIREIAEQTNLLALNAAIEAARAGEQGRGFSVVAEEVRKLASTTQTSTHQIQKLVEALHHGTREAVAVMDGGCQRARQNVERAENAGTELKNVIENIKTIKAINLDVATSVEQQSRVTSDIRGSVERISAAAARVSAVAAKNLDDSHELLKLADGLHDFAHRFEI